MYLADALANMQNFFSSEILNKAGVPHGFFTKIRENGAGSSDTLDCSMNKGAEEAYKNRDLVEEQMGFDKLFFCNQVHGSTCVIARATNSERDKIDGDAQLSTRAGIGVGVYTADCVPILISNQAGSITAAVHAGWKGALKGIIENTMIELKKKSHQDKWIAAIGPSISQKSYQVSEDLYDTWTQKSRSNKIFFQADPKSNQHYLFNLRGYCEVRLYEVGISEVDASIEYDTYEHEKLFFSCRRSYHRGEGRFGAFASVIGPKQISEFLF